MKVKLAFKLMNTQGGTNSSFFNKNEMRFLDISTLLAASTENRTQVTYLGEAWIALKHLKQVDVPISREPFKLLVSFSKP